MPSSLPFRSIVFAIAVAWGGHCSAVFAQQPTPNLGEPGPFGATNSAEIRVYPKSGKNSDAPRFNAAPAGKQQVQQPYHRTNRNAGTKNYYSELFGKQSSAARLNSQKQPSTSTPVFNAGYQNQGHRNSTNTVVPVSSTEKKPQSQEQSAGLPEWARNARPNKQPASTAASGNLHPPVSGQDLPEDPALGKTVPPMATLLIDRQPASTLPTLNNQQPQLQTQPTRSIPLGKIESGAQNPSVKIEWKSGSDINVAQESECELVVTNVGTSTAYGVQVDANLPATARLLEATPKPTSVTNSIHWNIGQLEQGQARKITIKLIPSQRGPLAATARVHFTGATQAAFVVREPMLGLKIAGPSQAMVGDAASQSVTISNPGNGITKNVQLEAIIPVGLEHPRGGKLVMDVGSLNPGETRTIRLALVAMGGGDQTVKVTASAEGGLEQKTQASVKVIAPSLQAEIEGPALRYKGRTASFKLSVKNDGTVSTSNVRLMHKVPKGFKFISASKGATYDAPTRILSWFVGRLESNQAAEMKVKLKAVEIGEFVHYIRTTSEHGSTTDSQLMTRVEGSAALVMEITDLDDPVEIGSETAYEIKVNNEGSADAKNVGLSCELPPGVQFLKATGPAKHVVEGNLIIFQAIPEIKAGKTNTFRIHVIGNKEGNLHFRARMTSAASPEPLTFEELTRFYGDGN